MFVFIWNEVNYYTGRSRTGAPTACSLWSAFGRGGMSSCPCGCGPSRTCQWGRRGGPHSKEDRSSPPKHRRWRHLWYDKARDREWNGLSQGEVRGDCFSREVKSYRPQWGSLTRFLIAYFYYLTVPHYNWNSFSFLFSDFYSSLHIESKRIYFKGHMRGFLEMVSHDFDKCIKLYETSRKNCLK